MKIIYVNARFLTQQITGVQRFAIEISKELKKLNNDIIFVSPSKNILHTDLAKELNIQTFGTLSGHLWEKIELFFFLKRKKNPLLINLCNSGVLSYQNQIITIHDLAVYKNPKWFSEKFVFLYKLMIPAILKNSKAIITVSEFSKEEIIKKFPTYSDKINVVYNSVNFSNKYELNRNAQKKYILSVGSLEPRKNIPNLIEAFLKSQVCKTHNLIIVGKGNRSFRQNNLDHSNDENIKFTGYVTDEKLISLYKNAEIFIYPSLYEGFGIPPLEAMYYQCPTMVSSSSSLPEVCGNASLYFNPYDLKSIIDSINIIGTSEFNVIRNTLISNGNIQINKYNWADSAKALNKIIKSLE